MNVNTIRDDAPSGGAKRNSSQFASDLSKPSNALQGSPDALLAQRCEVKLYRVPF